MVLTPVRPSTMHKVRFWDPKPNGNQLPPELRDSMFRLYRDMEIYFSVRKQMVGSGRIEANWPRTADEWDKSIRDKGRRLFYIYDSTRTVIAIGETFVRPRSFYHDEVDVRIYVEPLLRGEGLGTTLHGVMDYVTTEQAYLDGTDEAFVFTAFDPLAFRDDACLKWLKANNYQRRNDKWVRVV